VTQLVGICDLLVLCGNMTVTSYCSLVRVTPVVGRGKSCSSMSSEWLLVRKAASLHTVVGPWMHWGVMPLGLPLFVNTNGNDEGVWVVGEVQRMTPRRR